MRINGIKFRIVLKHFFFYFLSLLLILPFYASTISAQAVEWIDRFGDSSGRAYAIDIEDTGNAYVVGAVSSPYSFIRKEDIHGNGIWTHQFTLCSTIINASNQASGVVVDNLGNTYIAGHTNCGGTFGTKNAYLRKYDADGNVIWTRQFGFGEDVTAPGFDSFDSAKDVAIDGFGNVYVVGLTNGTAPGQINHGDFDGFLRKYDPIGNIIWTRQFGTAQRDEARGMATDESGNIYVIGVQETGTGAGPDFLRKFDTNGNELWIKIFTHQDFLDITVDDTGKIYLGGIDHSGDAFIGKYDGNGNEIWSQIIGSNPVPGSLNPIDEIRGVDVKDGNIVVAGITYGALPGQTYLGSGPNPFVRVYKTGGNEVWTHQFLAGNELTGVALINEISTLIVGYSPAFIAKVSRNQPPTADAGQDQSANEGASVTFDGSGSTDPDGVSDIVAYNWNFGDGNTGSGAIVTHTYADNGIYTATLTVTDTAGASSSDTATITVNNVAPTVGEITAPLDPVQVNTSITASAGFTDPGILDTHTAIWAWGDGNTSAGTVSEVNGSGSVTGSHTYTTPGVYTLTLTVTDKDGASGTSVFQYIVVYDPEGGFVTGGGWIDSPAGAYTANPSLTGRANFGFNSKYQNGANTPSGQTQFLFKVANLNFHGDVYEWLVVSGPKAQYKGSGIINGAGDYGFILTANDGAVSGGGGVDKFRLKVWDKTTGNIIYDNQLGDNDDANASTALGAGNIIIHN